MELGIVRRVTFFLGAIGSKGKEGNRSTKKLQRAQSTIECQLNRDVFQSLGNEEVLSPPLIPFPKMNVEGLESEKMERLVVSV